MASLRRWSRRIVHSSSRKIEEVLEPLAKMDVPLEITSDLTEILHETPDAREKIAKSPESGDTPKIAHGRIPC
jgi:hypothetical protein